MAAVWGIALRPLPWEELFSWRKPPCRLPGVTPPHVRVHPHFHLPCLGQAPLTSCTGGDRGVSGWCGQRKTTHTCRFGAGSLSYISSHRKMRQREVPLSLLRRPGVGPGGAPTRACGPQAWPCTTLETTETEACRAGSEEGTLEATWCLKTAQPVPGAWSPEKSRQSERVWGESRGSARGLVGQCAVAPCPSNPLKGAARSRCPGTGEPWGSPATSESAFRRMMEHFCAVRSTSGAARGAAGAGLGWRLGCGAAGSEMWRFLR